MALVDETRGPFAVGEIPEDMVMRFMRPTEQGGGPVGLSGYTAQVRMTRPNDAVEIKSADVIDPTDGRVRYTFVDGDFTDNGTYQFVFWVMDGTSIRLASKVVKLQVFDAPGGSP